MVVVPSDTVLACFSMKITPWRGVSPILPNGEVKGFGSPIAPSIHQSIHLAAMSEANYKRMAACQIPVVVGGCRSAGAGTGQNGKYPKLRIRLRRIHGKVIEFSIFGTELQIVIGL